MVLQGVIYLGSGYVAKTSRSGSLPASGVCSLTCHLPTWHMCLPPDQCPMTALPHSAFFLGEYISPVTSFCNVFSWLCPDDWWSLLWFGARPTTLAERFFVLLHFASASPCPAFPQQASIHRTCSADPCVLGQGAGLPPLRLWDTAHFCCRRHYLVTSHLLLLLAHMLNAALSASGACLACIRCTAGAHLPSPTRQKISHSGY